MSIPPTRIPNQIPFELEFNDETQAILARYQMAKMAGADDVADRFIKAEYARMYQAGLFWTPFMDQLAMLETTQFTGLCAERALLEYQLRLAKHWVRQYGHPVHLTTLARSFTSPSFRAMLAQNAPILSREFIDTIYEDWDPEDEFLKSQELWLNRYVTRESRELLIDWAVEQLEAARNLSREAITLGSVARKDDRSAKPRSRMPFLLNLFRDCKDELRAKFTKYERKKTGQRSRRIFDRMTLATNVLIDAARRGEIAQEGWSRIERLAESNVPVGWGRVIAERVSFACFRISIQRVGPRDRGRGGCNQKS